MRPLNKKSELKRLYKMGFGIHHLNKGQKNPVKQWNTQSRDSLETLLKEYKESYNLGTRLGKASKVGKGYLAILDVDVKSTDKAHKAEAIEWIKKNFPGLYEEAPVTLSGRGNGSMHIWVRVKEPMAKKRLYASPTEVVTLMPSAKPTERQVEVLGKKKIKEGWRLRPAFEIEFMCDGNQVVLPPSIHPDTGRPYKWGRPIEDAESIPLVNIEGLLKAIPDNKNGRPGRPTGSAGKQFDIVDVDEFELETRLDGKIVAAIYEGDEVKDRSAMMLSIALSMVRAQFEDSEILGVLTNKEYYIGDCAFEHAKTTNRNRAARWAYDYCIRKARSEADTREIFDCEVEVYETLSPEAKEEQLKNLVTPPEAKDWKSFLDRDGKGNLRPTFKNVRLILENVIGEELFIEDIFSYRVCYGLDTKWGAKKGDEVTEKDETHILNWFAEDWKIEPNDNNIRKAIIKIASRNQIHPVRQYLESLEWDGVPRIATWLKDYVGAEGSELYLREVSRKFLVAAVARIFEPGRKLDYMMILEGAQGSGKSTLGAILAGDDWFLDSLPDLHDKDAALNLQGNWIVEMGELANLKRADVNVAKDFISRRIDKIRPPYQRKYITSKRQCIFFGTTNNDDYLKDKTGNRRYWPVKVSGLDFEALKRDRDQLWAEAFYLYDMYNENLYLEDEARDIAVEVQASRVVEDESSIVHDILSDWYKAMKKARKQKMEETGKRLPPLKFRLKELFDDFGFGESGAPPLKNYKADNYRLQMVASSLRALKFEKYVIQGYSFWREKRD